MTRDEAETTVSGLEDDSEGGMSDKDICPLICDAIPLICPLWADLCQ